MENFLKQPLTNLDIKRASAQTSGVESTRILSGQLAAPLVSSQELNTNKVVYQNVDIDLLALANPLPLSFTATCQPTFSGQPPIGTIYTPATVIGTYYVNENDIDITPLLNSLIDGNTNSSYIYQLTIKQKDDPYNYAVVVVNSFSYNSILGYYTFTTSNTAPPAFVYNTPNLSTFQFPDYTDYIFSFSLLTAPSGPTGVTFSQYTSTEGITGGISLTTGAPVTLYSTSLAAGSYLVLFSTTTRHFAGSYSYFIQDIWDATNSVSLLRRYEVTTQTGFNNIHGLHSIQTIITLPATTTISYVMFINWFTAPGGVNAFNTSCSFIKLA